MNAIQIVTPAELAAGELGFDTSILAGSLAASSMATYAKDFRAYLQYAGSAGRALDAETLAQWRAHLATNTTLSPNTINRMIAAVKRLVKEAAAQGYCSRELSLAFQDVAGVKVKALKARQKAHARTLITPEDMRRICTAPNANTLPGRMHRALLATLASSGCRISEVVSLTPAQIHFGQDESSREGFYIEVMGKNQTEPRRAPISPEAHRLIEQWLAARSAAGVSIAAGSEPSAPASLTATVSACSCTPAIGAWTIGRSMPRRFCSVKVVLPKAAPDRAQGRCANNSRR